MLSMIVFLTDVAESGLNGETVPATAPSATCKDILMYLDRPHGVKTQREFRAPAESAEALFGAGLPTPPNRLTEGLLVFPCSALFGAVS
jgi:hypothetical protein